MFTLTISSTSLVDVVVPSFPVKAGVAYNPSADTVQMAFTTGGADPAGGDWKAATWETDTSSGSPKYAVLCLVGTGGTVALAKGTYMMWTKITDSPEIPVDQVGILIVT